MHRSLQIPEIVCMIAQCLSRTPDHVYLRALPCESRCTNREEAVKKQALLSLSLTSRSLLEPCLDALWACMMSARPLFGTIVFPEERIKPGEGDKPGRHELEIMALRLVERADWTRFHYYAPRIKGLIVCPGDLNIVVSRALSSCASTHASLLPNLRYLYWSDHSDVSFRSINCLAGPNITYLKLGLTAWRKESEQSLYATLWSLRETCPLLGEIAITDCNRNEHGADWQLVLLFSAFENVTSVKLSTAIAGGSLIFLSRMAHLRSLRGTLNETDPFISSTTIPLHFASLQQLHWTVCDLTEATTLLRRLQPPGHSGTRELKTLALARNDCDLDTNDLKLFLDALLSTCSKEALSSLVLGDGGTPDLMDEDDCQDLGLASADLRPLFQFGCIEELRLECLPVTLDDAFVAAAATAWPRLRLLRLESRVPRDCDITPAGLLPLARQCRWLEDLDVEVGSWPDPIPQPARGSAAGRRDIPLSVQVRYNVMKDSEQGEQDDERTARLELIRGMFPNAEVTYYYTNISGL